MNAPPRVYGPAPDVSLDDVEWRVQGNDVREFDGQSKALFLAYFDARIAARLMDEWVGPENWQDDYTPGVIGGKEAMWCTVSVRVGDEWVSKRDIGTAPNFEAQKGVVSDALKRAVTKWGPGRNIYDLPRLWATCKVGRNGTPYKTKETDADINRQLGKLGFAVSKTAPSLPVEQPSSSRATPAAKKTAAKVATSPDIEPTGVDEQVWGEFMLLNQELSEDRRREVRKFWIDTYGSQSPSRQTSTNAQITVLIGKVRELLDSQQVDEEAPF